MKEQIVDLGIVNWGINPQGGVAATNLGVLRFRTLDGQVHKFQGNRAARRRFIRENALIKGGN